MLKSKKVHCACSVSRDLLGVRNNHIFGIPNPKLSIHCDTYMGLRWKYGVFVYSWDCQYFKAKSSINFLSIAPKVPHFGSFRCLQCQSVKNVRSLLQNAHPCLNPRLLSHFCAKIGWGSDSKEARGKIESQNRIYFTYSSRSPHRSDCHQILCGAYFMDLINCAKRYVNPFRSFDYVGGRNVVLPTGTRCCR